MQMKLDHKEVVLMLRGKMKKSQIIFAIAIFLGIGVAIYSQEVMYLLMSLYFILLGALNLPNINRCKQDIYDYKNGKLKQIDGKVLDLFPNKDNNQNGDWIMFLGVGEGGEFVEFTLPKNPNGMVAIEKNVAVKYTSKNHIPVEVIEK